LQLLAVATHVVLPAPLRRQVVEHSRAVLAQGQQALGRQAWVLLLEAWQQSQEQATAHHPRPSLHRLQQQQQVPLQQGPAAMLLPRKTPPQHQPLTAQQTALEQTLLLGLTGLLL
jgi:hypothetical protein